MLYIYNRHLSDLLKGEFTNFHQVSSESIKGSKMTVSRAYRSYLTQSKGTEMAKIKASLVT